MWKHDLHLTNFPTVCLLRATRPMAPGKRDYMAAAMG
jgi:hypothetical protein